MDNGQRMNMKRVGLRAKIFAVAIAAACAAPAAAQLFAPVSLVQVQAPHKGGQPGIPAQPPGGGFERRGQPEQHKPQPQPQPDRRGQMTDDERRSLNQDLDKANRELYRRRPQQ